MNEIFTRRSVRYYLDKEVENEKITNLLKAGMQAPSAFNQQAWEFLVVKGRENLDKLSSSNQYANCLKMSNVAIVVLGDKNKMQMPEFWEQDLGAVTQNILLQAVTEKLGAVWIGTAPKKEQMQFVTDMFNLSDNLMPYSIVSIGYPVKEDANRFKDYYDESKVKFIK